MSQPDGGPAFPVADTREGLINTSFGMTLRDWFAGMALQGFLSRSDAIGMSLADALATWAYEQADAMLKAREVPS